MTAFVRRLMERAGAASPTGGITAEFIRAQRITAQLPSGQSVTKDVHWERGQKNQFELMS